MSAIDQTTDQIAQTNGHVIGDLGAEPTITLDLALNEAQGLRAWLLKPTKDGATSLEDPLVSRVLAHLARAVDSVQAAVNVRHELEQAGLAVAHLSDDQVRELGRRVTEAALPGVRS
ncbi:MAG TPA: hypothetical protein VID48_11090 [Solirubrobacteraceae bacterium]|jgi:hypothetical protein